MNKITNAVIERGPYEIHSHGILIGSVKWEATNGMAFQPPGYEAWVKLLGVPLHLWNSEGLKRITTKLGVIKCTLPHGQDTAQLEHITKQWF